MDFLAQLTASPRMYTQTYCPAPDSFGDPAMQRNCWRDYDPGSCRPLTDEELARFNAGMQNAPLFRWPDEYLTARFPTLSAEIDEARKRARTKRGIWN